MKKNSVFLITAVILASCSGDNGTSIHESVIKGELSGERIELSSYKYASSGNKDAHLTICMLDKELFDAELFTQMLDSVSATGKFHPFTIVSSDLSSAAQPEKVIADIVNEAIESGRKSDGKAEVILCGKADGADAIIRYSLEEDDKADAHWCFSPTLEDVNDYGMISGALQYKICRNVKYESDIMADMTQSLENSIRKRGGKVTRYAYGESDDIKGRTAMFLQLLNECQNR